MPCSILQRLSFRSILFGQFWNFVRNIQSQKWTLNHSKRIQTGPNDLVPCSICQRASFRSNFLPSILTVFGTFSQFRFYGFLACWTFRPAKRTGWPPKRTQERTLCHGASAGSIGTRYHLADTDISSSAHFRTFGATGTL